MAKPQPNFAKGALPFMEPRCAIPALSSPSEAALVSMAISLKRLADVLGASPASETAGSITIRFDGRMSARDAARYIGISEKTLAMHRCAGTGPKFIKQGRIYYYEEALNEWLHQSGTQSSTAQGGK